jgi:two-component system phosphate regulon sensor histidine kinase PhoR
MKITKPSLSLILGSLTLTVFCFALLGLINLIYPVISWIITIIISLLIGFLSYVIFRVLIYRLIKTRLDLIMKNVFLTTNADTTNHAGKSMDILLDDVELEIEGWESEKIKEIDKLKEQEAFRREFLGNLSHELKTPIFSIQGYILTLLDGGIDDPKVNKLFLERASKVTDRMVSIIDDLDQITKIEADSLKLEIRPFDLIDLIQDIIESLEKLAKEKYISLKINRENNVIVEADKHKIAQVLTNLIGNSIFYGKSNGNTLISVENVDNLVLVSVSDDGPGIEEIHLNRLFERFYRVEKSRNRNEGGSGLGLAIVKHILEAHGQSVSVKSQVGKGSVFSFALNRSKSNTVGLYSSRGVQIK